MTPPATPTFSVLIAAYQAADTVAASVESALGQISAPHEVIVSDDGSTDDLDQALAPFSGRIRLLRREHRGVAAALNEALRVASGDFALPLDADDVLLPGCLEALGRLAAARPGLDLLCTDAWFVEGGDVVGRFYAENEFASSQQRAAILDSCFVGWPAARRSSLLEVGGWDESLITATDWDLWMRMVFAGATAGLVDQPLRRYIVRPGSLSADRTRSLWERVTLLDRLSARGHLHASERPRLASARRAAVARARREEARQALLARRPSARGRALALARTPGAGRGSRALGLGGALAPRVVARLIARGIGRTPGEGRAPQRPSSSS